MNIRLSYLSLIFIGLFIVLTLLVNGQGLKFFDLTTTTIIQKITPKFLDSFLSLFSLIGSFELISILLVLILFLIKKITGIFVFFLYGFGHSVEVLGKIFITHPGPPFKFFRYSLDFIFPSSQFSTGYSYPSGHSYRTVFIAVILIYFIYKFLKMKQKNKIILTFLVYFLTLVMLYSRVTLGEHWVTDVIGGSLLGLGFGFLSIYLIDSIFVNNRV